MEDDDDFNSGTLYIDGCWKFDDTLEELVFIRLFQDDEIISSESSSWESNRPPSVSGKKPKLKQLITSEIEFRNDIDVFEQQMYRRRYQRRVPTGQPDVITVQDLKDLTIFTAPMKIMTPKLIQILHVPTTDRLIRAAIMYFQYYIQVSALMETRMKELSTKIRTRESELVESEYHNNLCDLRAIFAKEYCSIILGSDDTKKFHHKGADKKQKSLHDTDARFFEVFIRFLVQIVWMALGRVFFNVIEIEMNRLFKTTIYNSAEHTLKTGYIDKMSKYEQDVILGPCVSKSKNRYYSRSPLTNEVFCYREMDFRMMALGSIDVREQRSTERILFFERALTEPEDNLPKLNISVGLLGIPRALFDTMLHPLLDAEEKPKTTTKMSMVSNTTNLKLPRASTSSKKSTAGPAKKQNMYPPLVLPPRATEEIYYPPDFPPQCTGVSVTNKEQLRKWQNRLRRYYK